MDINFIFVLFLVGTIIASCQDFKRREIDRWLTYFLLISGAIYVVVNVIVNSDISLLIQGAFVFGIMFLVSNLMYYAKFFAGGDCSLFFGLSAMFVGSTFLISSMNILSFLAVLFICGSIYGILYTGILYFKHFSAVNVEIKKMFKDTKAKWILLACVPFVVGSFFVNICIPFAVVFFLAPLLFVFMKAVENIALIKKIRGSELRVGDWLKDDVVVNGKMIKSSFYGITEKDLEKLKRKKEVCVKDGIPFAPVFFLALIVSIFYFDRIFFFIFQLFL